MASFNLAPQLAELQRTHSIEEERRPLIAITGNFADDRLQLLPG